jgi:adenylate kinase
MASMHDPRDFRDAAYVQPFVGVLVGPPGAGKGVQGELLASHFGWDHISSGDLLRRAARTSPMGSRVEAVVRRGELVPDDAMLTLLAEHLRHSPLPPHGVLLDGFPRTIEQAETLRFLYGPQTADAVIELDVPPGIARSRLARRRRSDDLPGTVAHRFDVYEQETAPVIEWLARSMPTVRVAADASPDEVWATILQQLHDQGVEEHE